MVYTMNWSRVQGGECPVLDWLSKDGMNGTREFPKMVAVRVAFLNDLT